MTNYDVKCCFKLFQSCVQTSYSYQTVHEPRGKNGRLQVFANSGKPSSAFFSWDFPQHHFIQQLKPSCTQLKFMFDLGPKPQKTCKLRMSTCLQYMFRRKDLKMYDLSYSVDKQHHQPNLLWFRLTCLWISLQHLWDAFQVTMSNRHHTLRTLKEEITPEATRNTVMPVRAITTAAYEYQRSQPVSSYLILQNCNSNP